MSWAPQDDADHKLDVKIKVGSKRGLASGSSIFFWLKYYFSWYVKQCVLLFMILSSLSILKSLTYAVSMLLN